MHDESEKYLSALVGFGVGALVGAGLALLLAPKTDARSASRLYRTGKGRNIHARPRRKSNSGFGD
jgi:gas vesicle protein